MQFAALFIEYFVSGITLLTWLVPALIWLFPPIHSDLILKLLESPQFLVFFLTPTAYVLGHLVDGLSSFLLQAPKHLIRWVLRNRRGFAEKATAAKKYASVSTFLLYASPEVGGHFNALSSRDRIARGVMLNLFAFSALVFGRFFTSTESERQQALLVLGWIAFILAIGFFALWVQFEGASYVYKLNAVATIEQVEAERDNSKL